jgi:hypothetical protein
MSDDDPSNPAVAFTAAGGPIAMSSSGKHKRTTELDGSTLRLSRIVADPRRSLWKQHSILDMGVE